MKLKDALLNHIIKGEIERVIVGLNRIRPQLSDTDMQNRIILRISNFNTFQNEKKKGTITQEATEVKYNQVKDALIEIIRDLPDDFEYIPELDIDLNHTRHSKNRIVWFIWGSILMVMTIAIILYVNKKWHTQQDKIMTEQRQVIDTPTVNPEKTRKKNSGEGQNESEKNGETPQYKPDCSGKAIQTNEMNGINGKLMCCYRDGNSLICNFIISRKIGGNLQICANESTWKSTLTDDIQNTYLATLVQSKEKSSSRCLELQFTDDITEIEVSIIFENVNPGASKIKRLKVPLSVGNLVFKDFYII